MSIAIKTNDKNTKIDIIPPTTKSNAVFFMTNRVLKNTIAEVIPNNAPNKSISTLSINHTLYFVANSLYALRNSLFFLVLILSISPFAIIIVFPLMALTNSILIR